MGIVDAKRAAEFVESNFEDKTGLTGFEVDLIEKLAVGLLSAPDSETLSLGGVERFVRRRYQEPLAKLPDPLRAAIRLDFQQVPQGSAPLIGEFLDELLAEHAIGVPTYEALTGVSIGQVDEKRLLHYRNHVAGLFVKACFEFKRGSST